MNCISFVAKRIAPLVLLASTTLISGCLSSTTPILQPEKITPALLRMGFYEECRVLDRNTECSQTSAVYVADAFNGTYLLQSSDTGLPNMLTFNRIDAESAIVQIVHQTQGRDKLHRVVQYGLAMPTPRGLIAWTPECKFHMPVVQQWAADIGAQLVPKRENCVFSTISKANLLSLLVALRREAIASGTYESDNLKLYRPISDRDGEKIWAKSAQR